MGRSLPDLRKQITDSGLTVESAIGFTSWIVDDPQRRAAGLEETKRAMEIVAAIEGRRIAALLLALPMFGSADLRWVERYRALLELGDQIGVVPQSSCGGFPRRSVNSARCWPWPPTVAILGPVSCSTCTTCTREALTLPACGW